MTDQERVAALEREVKLLREILELKELLSKHDKPISPPYIPVPYPVSPPYNPCRPYWVDLWQYDIR